MTGIIVLMDEKGLGNRLQAARRAAGLTQQALCHKANLSYSTLAKIERGAIKSPSIFTIQNIAEALDTSLDVLLGITTGNNAGGNALASPTPPRLTSKSGIRFVYFDINGCLVYFFHQAFVQIAQDTGISPDVIESTFWHFNDEACRGSLTIEQFNQAFAQRLNLPKMDWQQYYFDALKAMPGMAELVTWAASKYYVGLLSNIMPGFIQMMQEKHLLPEVRYDAIVDSSQVGAIKPEPQIYSAAGEKAAPCAPHEILLIDDSRTNLMAAERMGWHVLWFDGYNPEESIARIRSALEPAGATEPLVVQQ